MGLAPKSNGKPPSLASALFTNGKISAETMAFAFYPPTASATSFISYGGMPHHTTKGKTTSHETIKNEGTGWLLNLKNVLIGNSSFPSEIIA